MAKRDYYEVLGVAKDASLDQIKKSYRQLALKFHPDRNPGDKAAEESFKEATEAYQVISNEDTRAKYDRFGHAAFSNNGGGDFSDFGSFAEEIFGDIFGAFFGGGTQRSSKKKGGRDLRYTLELTLEEAAAGVEKKIKIRKPVPCGTCKGTGCREGSSPEKCRHCGGNGQVRVQQGFFTLSRPCPSCSGRGMMIADPCPGCGGSGKGTKESEVLVQVPAGIDAGQQLRLRGEGEVVSEGHPAGDLYVEISLAPHPIFKRQDTEIVCEMPMSYAQAVLGGETEVPTLHGPISMKIPPGTESGKVFRLRGKGVVDMQSGRYGDQHVRAYIHVPQQITERQRELLEELATIEGKPVANHESRSFFEKVKEFFD